jgi:hypothetical protein
VQHIASLDLSKLAATLDRESRHPELVRAIDKAAAAGSTREDLRGALASLRLIQQILDRSAGQPGPHPTDHEETTLTGALFTQAVILYARATTTKGDRPKLLGEAKLTPAQRAVHDQAVRLRDSVIAHFGRGDALADGPLVREAVILSLFSSETGPKKQVSVYTTRAQHKVHFSAQLIPLIETRLAHLAARHQQLFDEADRALGEAVRSDPDLGRSLRDHEFDVDAFCASPDAAARMRAQLHKSSMEDMDYTVAVPRP